MSKSEKIYYFTEEDKNIILRNSIIKCLYLKIIVHVIFWTFFKVAEPALLNYFVSFINITLLYLLSMLLIFPQIELNQARLIALKSGKPYFDQYGYSKL